MFSISLFLILYAYRRPMRSKWLEGRYKLLEPMLTLSHNTRVYLYSKMTNTNTQTHRFVSHMKKWMNEYNIPVEASTSLSLNSAFMKKNRNSN